ncbi:type I restriction-modification system, R subunit, site-specific deoxyribonuclease, HsdR family [Teredinibacter turnerae T7901]|uniref:Type I restriction enzyme endonuclease subunit n=1 Tax=Teredinibacter turnerae (strain ATCC 39867 / T7901) TaxID=377629 RepID=C5BTJ2_TERTT|nr:type I restriction endonuclease subunit R [Teredinibacter turnerae]ACR13261.1 type I restriction-modification system, R subunit, site-specific deoxyribonuclease, HsdR family [Teredinibacter turnerae T7901]
MAMTEETLVQEVTADYLLNQLQWDESVLGMYEKLGQEGDLGRLSEQEVVLTRYLGAKLIELNPDLPDIAYQEALRVVCETPLSTNIVAVNKEKYSLHKNGVEVSFHNDKGERVKRRLRLFDFDNYENNHFLLVREFWIKGEIYRRRADLVGFVNGIPLLFMEVKNVHKDIRAAYEQNLADYKDTVPHLFYHNAFIILGNGIDAKIGSVSSKFEHFNDWKRLKENEPGVVDMETLLKGTCSKTNLMDIFENFTLFDQSSGRLMKIVARNHQYLGVSRAIDAVANRGKRLGKLGVFWHTQGSGKSYSIVFFAQMVHRKLGGNYTFVVLTDREDLDTQIYKTFAGCGLVDNDKDPCRADSEKDLKALIGQQKAVVFTLIQKFNDKVDPKKPYSERDDIIVITDEAHRTQYGTLSLNMRNALPNASFIGFTGTPLFKDDEITKKVFGDYISTYDFQRAVEDKATVPLYYDARGEELMFTDEDGNEHTVADPKGINERIAEKLDQLEIEDVDVQQRLERELKRDYHIITATSRLDQIARDFVAHYANAWETGKAMLVCLDKITCVRMHKLIDFYWQQEIKTKEKALASATDEQDMAWQGRQLVWMKETLMAVVVSEEQGEVAKFEKWGLDIKPHRQLLKAGFELVDGSRLDMEEAFKSSEHPFRVAFVCAMWLTGFDVPTLSTLYLDKPLKAHTLMQAIARANRVAEGKNNGLIVDYCGILKNLRKALATFAGAGDEGHDSGEGENEPAKPNEELLESLNESISLVAEFLRKHGFEISRINTETGFAKNAAIAQAKEIINQNDETRKRFEVMAREVFNKFKACINVPGVNGYRDMRDAINILYKSLQADKEIADISDIMKELYEIVDGSIDTSRKIKEPKPDGDRVYDISKIDFEKLRQEFSRSERKNTTVQSLKAAVEKKLARLMMQNPLRTDYQEHYEKLVKEYNQEKDRVVIEKTFEALLKLNEELSHEEKRAIREGLDEESLVLFDLLSKQNLQPNEIAKIKQVATTLLETLKAERLKVANWQQKESTRDAVKQQIFDFLYDDRTGLPVAQYEDDEISDITERVFLHIYRAYPELPSPIYG